MTTLSLTERIAKLELQLVNPPNELLKTFWTYKLHSLTRPSVWRIEEAVIAAKQQIERNMDTKGYRSYSRLDRYTSYMSRADQRTDLYQAMMNRRREWYWFGKEVAKCVKYSDHNELITLLNDNDSIRDMDTSRWVDMLNNTDLFPDCPSIDYCSDCNYIEYEDDGSWVYDGDRWVCSSCREDNYRWSDYHDTVVHEDEEEPEDEYDEEEEEDPSSIGSYHSSRRKLGFIPTSFSDRKTKVYLGLELEMEVVEDARRDKAEYLMERLGKYTTEDGDEYNYCFLEDDGSLNHGFEMVTGYTGLDVHAKQLEFFKRPWANVKSHDTKTCGLHVHICKGGMSMFHAAKLILFMHDSRNQRLFRAIARRDANRYSQVKNKTGDYSWLKHARRGGGLQRLNDDRYEAVNFQPEKTIEFRLFKGTLRYETIMACLEFTYATWFFTRDTGQQDLTAEQFLKYICQPSQRKDTTNLRSFLRSKGFSLDKSALVKPNPRTEKPEVTAEV